MRNCSDYIHFAIMLQPLSTHSNALVDPIASPLNCQTPSLPTHPLCAAANLYGRRMTYPSHRSAPLIRTSSHDVVRVCFSSPPLCPDRSYSILFFPIGHIVHCLSRPSFHRHPATLYASLQTLLPQTASTSVWLRFVASHGDHYYLSMLQACITTFPWTPHRLSNKTAFHPRHHLRLIVFQNSTS